MSGSAVRSLGCNYTQVTSLVINGDVQRLFLARMVDGDSTISVLSLASLDLMSGAEVQPNSDSWMMGVIGVKPIHLATWRDLNGAEQLIYATARSDGELSWLAILGV